MADAVHNGGLKITPDKITRRRRIFRSFEAKSLSNRNIAEKAADSITELTGSILFLILNIYWFVAWIILNIGIIPGLKPFDPFPFGLLTMIVSLEAIILSIFVLLSQNRAARIDSLRAELNLQVNLIAEEEITKCLEMLDEIQKKMGMRRKYDKELDRMLNRIDTSYIERTLQKQLDNSGTPKIINNLVNISNGNVKSKDGEKLPEKIADKK